MNNNDWITLFTPPYKGEDEEYIVTIKGASKATALWWDGEHWYDEYNNFYEVSAWKLLPEAYTVEKDYLKIKIDDHTLYIPPIDYNSIPEVDGKSIQLRIGDYTIRQDGTTNNIGITYCDGKKIRLIFHAIRKNDKVLSINELEEYFWQTMDFINDLEREKRK